MKTCSFINERTHFIFLSFSNDCILTAIYKLQLPLLELQERSKNNALCIPSIQWLIKVSEGKAKWAPAWEKKKVTVWHLYCMCSLPVAWLMVRNKGDIPRYHMSRTIAYTYGIVLVALFSIIEIFIFESDEVLQRSIETLHFHIFSAVLKLLEICNCLIGSYLSL